MIVCGFYTNDVYKSHALRMKVSAEQFGLEVDLQQLPDQGSWNKNTCMKPKFAKQMLDKHLGETVLLVDTDAVFRSAPERLLRPLFHEDVALFFAGNGHPSSGTMFFRNTSRARIFCNFWQTVIENHKDDPSENLEYETLVQVTTKPRVVPIHHLGPEYFWVERQMRPSYPGAIPVIEHFMISKE